MEMSVSHFAPGSEGLLAPLAPWLKDSEVSEILINQPNEVFIEKSGSMRRFETPMLDRLHLKRLFTLLANENGQVLNETSPMLSGNLMDGSRVQLVIPPTSKHYTLSIRRQSIASRTLGDYQSSDFYGRTQAFLINNTDAISSSPDEQYLMELYSAKQWPDFIAEAILTKKNIVISGETSSGKTTFLNACCQQIPAHERLITLEDTFEVNLPHANKVSLKALKCTENAKATITMQDLVQCSLRLRPERLIMGEIRGREILDFISACSTGHDGSITSIHASNPRMAFMRMVQMYKLNNLPSMRDEEITAVLKAVIDVILQVKKTAFGRELVSVYYKEANRDSSS